MTMKHIESTIRKVILQDHFTDLIIKAIDKAGGTAYAIGGIVRDILLQDLKQIPLVIQDIDIEVHGLSYEQLEQLLSTFGPVSFVGKSFGVLKLHGSNVDFALPRTDSSGRKPIVEINPFMGITAALKRRDLTINAMAINLHTYELIDPFNGYQDLQNTILRSPDITFFPEDPLRFFRVMQFISRFEMYPDTELQETCRTMDISKISIERIENEFYKLLMMSKRPSLGIRWLEDCGRLQEILPELYNTIATKQEHAWHPEGSVFEHSMQALDAASRFTYKDRDQRIIGLYAALCHDLGKVSTTIFKDGRLRSPGHDEAGIPLAKKMLSRITCRKDILKAVPMLVKKHMQPANFVKLNAGIGAYKRLAVFFGNTVTIDQLVLLCYSDRQGRNPESHIPFEMLDSQITEFKRKAEEYGVLFGPEEAILSGKDIIQYIQPGPKMGRILEEAYNLQINDNIQDKDELLRKIFHRLKQN